MIYSRWRPDRGGYDYFETPERYGLADDLPVPRLTPTSSIGVASIDAGRVPEGSMRKIGSGALARGVVMPTSRAGLSGLPLFDQVPTWAWIISALGLGVAIERWRR